MAKIDDKVAGDLFATAIKNLVAEDAFTQPEPGTVWVLQLVAANSGWVLGKMQQEPFEVVERLSGGKLSRECWEQWTQPGSLWVVCLLNSNGETYRAVVQVLNAPRVPN